MKPSIVLMVWLGLATVAAAATDVRREPGLRSYYPVPKADPPQSIDADLCAYGATPAGVTAAIQATRMGRSAVLVEFGRHVGGMTSSGLSATDGGRNAKGIASEFYAAVGGFGLAKGNFPETGGWPHQLYVREGRRMVSDYVMTQHNCTGKAVAEARSASANTRWTPTTCSGTCAAIVRERPS